jgi:uncharacterized membrane protein
VVLLRKSNDAVYRIGVPLIRMLALGAAAVSAYLLFLSLTGGSPAGCGPDSPCEQVLASRWSKVVGVPVAALAAVVYLMAFLATFAISPVAPPRRQRIGWSVLLGLSIAAAGAGGWFAYLQLARMDEMCVWCLSVHAIGLLLLGSVVACLSRAARIPGVVALGARPVTAAALAALLAIVALAAAQQYILPPPVPPRIFTMSLPDGQIPLSLDDVPTLGPRKAPHVVVVLADYTCPHCRHLHHSLEQAAAAYPNQFCIAVVVVPLNLYCNRYVRTAPRAPHVNACELAKLSLAVYRAKPKVFAEYDRWLFDGTTPREPADARQKAVQLAGADALARAEAGAWVGERLKKNVELYSSAYGTDRPGKIPVLILKDQVITNIPDDAGWATIFLRDALGLK